MSTHAGSFLVARPILKDSSFRQSVILLLQHSGDGAFGLVVNRPAKVEGLPFPIYAGGPCESEGLLMLHGHANWLGPEPDEPAKEVAPGIFLGNSTCLARVNDPGAAADLRFRMFAGYAGWAPDQLEGELVGGAWALVPASGELLFDTPAEELWPCILPPSIPQPSVN